MKRFGPARLGLEDRLIVDAALDEAFGPLRARTANIGAARVRAAVRWSQGAPRPLGGFALWSRIGELSVAAVISAFLFGASLASVSSVPDISRDTASTGVWMLNGRTALQRPMDSRAVDSRLTAGELADNAAIVRRAAARPDHEPELTSTNR